MHGSAAIRRYVVRRFMVYILCRQFYQNAGIRQKLQLLDLFGQMDALR